MNLIGSVNTLTLSQNNYEIEYTAENVTATWPTATWSQIVATVSSYGIAISEDGKIQLYVIYSAGGLCYLSTNSGVSFSAISSTQISSAGNRTGCCMSANGQYMAVISNGSVYKSSDQGVTFTIATAASGTAISMSPTGKYMVVGNSNIMFSENFGVTWSVGGRLNGTPITGGWQSCTVSDGRYVVFVSAPSNVVYYSNDCGLNILASSGIPTTSYYWFSACSNRTGKYVTISASFALAGPPNHYSSDYGATFTASDSGHCISVACSGSGKYQLGLRINNTPTIYSKDYGKTWLTISPAQNYAAGNRGWVAMSDDGKVAVFTGFGNPVMRLMNDV